MEVSHGRLAIRTFLTCKVLRDDARLKSSHARNVHIIAKSSSKLQTQSQIDNMIEGYAGAVYLPFALFS